MRWYNRGGDPAIAQRGGVKRKNAAERFEKFVNKTDTCWLWTGQRTPAGYGKFWLDGRTLWAHRHSFEMAVGAIPAGLVLDHLCRVPACVNPLHLEPVTVAENTRRGDAPSVHRALQILCKRGHRMTPENCYLKKNGNRDCKACCRIRSRAWKAARRAGMT